MLVVDDEIQILRVLRINLEARGYLVTTTQRGDEALRFVREEPPDLVILDLELTGTTGLEVLESLRATSEVPVLILSARSGDPEKLLALDEGANDFLAKPFSMGDLIVRVRALLRGERSDLSTLTTTDFTLDFDTATASRGGEPVTFTEVEWKVLRVLVGAGGRLVSERQLRQRVFGEGPVEDDAHVRHHVTSIRRKLEPEPARPRYLRTEPGIGYRFYGVNV
ncbi:MAG: response regulator transcription factor [Acidimicrobiales bacterium]